MLDSWNLVPTIATTEGVAFVWLWDRKAYCYCLNNFPIILTDWCIQTLPEMTSWSPNNEGRLRDEKSKTKDATKPLKENINGWDCELNICHKTLHEKMWLRVCVHLYDQITVRHFNCQASLFKKIEWVEWWSFLAANYTCSQFSRKQSHIIPSKRHQILNGCDITSLKL